MGRRSCLPVCRLDVPTAPGCERPGLDRAVSVATRLAILEAQAVEHAVADEPRKRVVAREAAMRRIGPVADQHAVRVRWNPALDTQLAQDHLFGDRAKGPAVQVDTGCRVLARDLPPTNAAVLLARCRWRIDQATWAASIYFSGGNSMTSLKWMTDTVSSRVMSRE
jgi:UDP-N-acetylmuramyl tripeptide synthase